jgi:uncharacterized protein (DUF488 family)
LSTLWALGHGRRPIEELLAALRAHRIEVLADVRSIPFSKRNPQFSQAALRASVEAAGIAYEHRPALGGRREEPYPQAMEQEDWQAAFAALLALAEKKRTCILCAETDPLRCHRRFLAERAAAQGWEVVHILDADRVARPAARQARLRGWEPSSPGSR